MEEGDFEMTKQGEIIIVEEKDSSAEVTDSKSLSYWMKNLPHF